MKAVYALLFVSDEISVLEAMCEPPCIICTNEPLLVVKHKSSDNNTGPWDAGIWNISPVIVCEEFSHGKGNEIYDGIMKILSLQCNLDDARSATTDLVRRLREKDLLGALDELAAICQTQLLGKGSISDDLETLETNCLKRYPGIEKEYKKVKKCPEEKLKMIKKEAERILGLVPASAS